MSYFRARYLGSALLLVVCMSGSLNAQTPITLRIAGWNVEGNGNDIDPDLIEQQLAEKDGIDIWGLSEVRPGLFDEFLRGAADGEGAPFDIVEGTTGNSIRLAIIFDTGILDLLDSFEVDEPQFSNHRAPLVAHFRGRRTQQEFLFMVNHLASGSASANQDQALALNLWANQQSLPVISVGDYNFRLSLDDGSVRPGLGIMRNGPWFELEPVFLARTQANFNSILDHVFIANRDQAVGWSGEARIINRNGDQPATTTNFSDNSSESDHRPVDAILTFQPVPPIGGGPDPALADRVEALEQRLDSMDDLLQTIEATLRQLADLIGSE